MKTCKHIAFILLIAGYFLATSMSYAASPQYPPAPGQPATARGAAEEQHPVIRKALQQLQTVRNELQNQAAHDFHGHRENALKHVDEAIKELNLALESDRH